MTRIVFPPLIRPIGLLALAATLLVAAGCGGAKSTTTAERAGAGTATTVGEPLGTGLDGVDVIDVTVTVDGDGVATVSWPAVPKVAYYRVTAQDDDRNAVWSWEGDATEVELGAGTPIDADRPGSPATVTVTAWSADGPLAASARTRVG